MNRRNFLKALGLGTSASALSACGLDNNIYYTPIEQILPYVVKPADTVPGTPTFYATTVTRGPHAHPVLARHRDGRVINVGENRKATWSKGVSKAALLELQKHYSPDRFKGPRTGGNDGAAITWDDGIKQVIAAVQDARRANKTVAWLGGYRSGAFAELVQQVTDRQVFWEPLGYEAEATAAEALFGKRVFPRWDLTEATYVLSFGAGFLGEWGGDLATTFGRARSVEYGGKVARFAMVSPYKDQTGANADDWYAVVPGSQAMVARAIAKLVAERKGYTGPALAALGAVDTAAAAAAAGIEPAALELIANQFAAAKGVAIPGGPDGASAAATELAAATYLLNIIAGAAPTMFNLGGYTAPIHNTAELEALFADLEAGRIGVIFVDDANPVYAASGMPAAAAIARADLSVAFSSHPDETTAVCKLILPAADGFEDWGDEEPTAGVRLLRQPSMSPLRVAYQKRTPGATEQIDITWDVRPAGEILVALGKATNTVQHASWRDFLRASWASQVYEPLVGAPARERARAEAEALGQPAPDASALPAPETTRGFATWFNEALGNGFAIYPHPASTEVPALTGSIQWQGAVAPSGSGDFFLHVAPHAHIGDGRYANSPWAQETPNPLTGHVWDSWVEIHPDAAQRLGVRDNDAVSLKTAAGTLSLGVEITRAVRPDVVAVQFGQGHTANGRYATDTGANVATLIPFAKDPQGARVWQGVKVAVASEGRKAGLVSNFGGDSDEDRNFTAKVNVKQFEAAHGDAPHAHPGELTGIHHLQLDKRLVDAGITDFYGLSQHPTYRFGMAIDTDQCHGCGSCVIACYAENNLPVVGKDKIGESRSMSWLRVNRYYKGDETYFVPMMCQQCGHAPCESVCPVLATYHNLDGLNAMVYNRCVGTRYCSNACPFSVRKFNFHTYVWPEPFNLQLNPDVVTRTMGVMEKCTFCVQRIRTMKTAYKDQASTRVDFHATIPDEALRRLPACAEACPTDAIVFGNLNDQESGPTKLRKSGRNYFPLEDLNVMSAVNYLAQVSFHTPEVGDGHGDGH